MRVVFSTSIHGASCVAILMSLLLLLPIVRADETSPEALDGLAPAALREAADRTSARGRHDALRRSIVIQGARDDRTTIDAGDLKTAGLPMIGKFKFKHIDGEPYYGSAVSLIRRDIILTAYHNMFDDNDKMYEYAHFEYVNEHGVLKVAHVSHVIARSVGGSNRTANDQVALMLTAPLETELLPSHPPPIDIQNRMAPGADLFVVAYNNDRQLNTNEYLCKMRDKRGLTVPSCRDPRIFLHDCDIKGGSSGGPIFMVIDGNNYLVGVQVGDAEGSPDYNEFNVNSHYNAGVFLDPEIVRKIAALPDQRRAP